MAEKVAQAPKKEEDYELLPHKELDELRAELQQLKKQPTEKTLQINMVELASKLDRMMDIFEEAQEMIRVEEGALTFQEKMRPLMDRMDKVLEQNSQIAEGIVGLHDLIMDLKSDMGAPKMMEEPEETKIEPFSGLDDKIDFNAPAPPSAPSMSPPPLGAPVPPPQPSGIPPPPPPR